MAYYPVHQATRPGEDLGTGVWPSATRARYPVQRSTKSATKVQAPRKPDAIHGFKAPI
jgi:hypothetical protein